MAVNWLALPRPLLQQCLARLDVDERLLCTEVCRSWRDALNDPTLWTRLQVPRVSPRGDGEQRNAALLRAAARRARGGLQFLDVSALPFPIDGVFPEADDATFEALLDVCAANAGSLRELTTVRRGRISYLPDVYIGRLLDETPFLETLDTALQMDDGWSRPGWLDKPWPALRVRCLCMISEFGEAQACVEDACLPHLTTLYVFCPEDTPQIELRPLLQACRARGIERLGFVCYTSVASV